MFIIQAVTIALTAGGLIHTALYVAQLYFYYN